MSVYIGDVPTFKQVSLDKIQALKVLEESSEVVDAFKAYYETRQTDWTEPDNVTDYQMARQHLLDECADVIQATCNLLFAIGEMNMTETLGRCKAKNERRGYEYTDDRECITDSGKLSDSREQLEADVRKVLQSAYMYAWMHGYENRRGCSFEKLHSEFYSLLDRQAAITEREAFMRGRASLDDEFSEYQAILEATKRAIAKADGTWTEDDDGAVAVVFAPDVDKLIAERDKLREELRIEREAVGACNGCSIVDELTAERDELERANSRQARKIHGVCEINEKLTAERDKWRDKFGKALDLAHEIARLAE